VDDLFFEFARLIEGLQPRVFTAENVSGLVKGVAKGYFLQILARLKACGYRVGCKVLDAQWLGVPQARKRTIFVGVREDLGREPVFPKPLPFQHALGEALANVPGEPTKNLGMGRYAIGPEWDRLKPGESSRKYFNLVRPRRDRPCPTICASHGHPGVASVTHPDKKRKLTIAELKRVCGFPDDFVLTGSYAQQWERLGRAVPPVMSFHIAKTIRDEILNV